MKKTLFVLVFSGLFIAVPEIYAQDAQEEYNIPPDPDKKVIKLIEKVKEANTSDWKDTTLVIINDATKDTIISINCKFLDATLNGIYTKVIVDTSRTIVIEVFVMDIETKHQALDISGGTRFKKKKGDEHREILFGSMKQYKIMLRQAIQ